MDRLYAYKRVVCWVLPILVMAVMLSSCYTNQSIMLKTPDGYPFATYNDSLNNKDVYRIAVADLVSINVYTNDGRQRLGISIDPLVSGVGSGGSNGMLQQTTMAYNVEPDSTLHIPILGRINVVGLTIRETEDLFKERFSKYYNSPYIDVRVTNRRFMVFIGGNVARVVNMVNEKTTLIEALAIAGGIPPLSKAHNIKLIRGNLANPTVYQIDLSTLEGAKLGGSMVIQANDIIYVEPVKRNFDQALQQSLGYITAVVGLISVTATIIFLLKP
jgi:polysaccharide export outer membrane protein